MPYPHFIGAWGVDNPGLGDTKKKESGTPPKRGSLWPS